MLYIFKYYRLLFVACGRPRAKSDSILPVFAFSLTPSCSSSQPSGQREGPMPTMNQSTSVWKVSWETFPVLKHLGSNSDTGVCFFFFFFFKQMMIVFLSRCVQNVRGAFKEDESQQPFDNVRHQPALWLYWWPGRPQLLSVSLRTRS